MSDSMTANAPHVPRDASTDRLRIRPTVLWLGLTALCCALWEADRGSFVLVLLAAVLGYPLLAIGSLVTISRAAMFRRWRRLFSHLAAVLLCLAALVAIADRWIDLDMVHFYLVKYPHALQLRLLPPDARRHHTWSWGLEAPLAGPGVAYDLVYDASGSGIREDESKYGRSMLVRPLGDHFYFVAGAEDGNDVCPQVSDLGAPLRRLGLGSTAAADRWLRACEARSGKIVQ